MPATRLLRPRRLGLVAALGVAALAAATAGHASTLVDRAGSRPKPGSIKLQVNDQNAAVITYRDLRGKRRRVVAWGAVNAVIPRSPNTVQATFKLQYLGASGPVRAEIVRGTFRNSCRRYDGPKLEWLVSACKAADGSYWAVQAWQRPLPNYGLAPSALDLRAWEIRLSHWSGALPVLTAKTDWAYAGRYDHFYGSFTYLGKPLYGFKTTSYGAPLDKFGVLIYLDTFNSAYGRGWKRENSFVTHNPNGIFCYSMNSHTVSGRTRPPGKGLKYRMTVQSPGALPDIGWQGNSPGAYDPAKDRAANEEQARSFSDKGCRPN